MKEEKKESPIGVLWGWGKPYHGKFIGSIILAVLGVACQMVPYFCVAHIVTLMLSGEQDFSSYMTACIVALCGYLGKVVFANLSTVISHCVCSDIFAKLCHKALAECHNFTI